MMKEIDARGLPCPRPVVITKKALDEIEEGTLTVLVDSPESKENVQRFARSQGCQVNVTESNSVFSLEIVKGQNAAAEAKKSTDVVLVASDQLGTGDERLGEILINAFLNTLWDSDPKPARLVFINDGVRLTSEGSEVLETLELLEQAGVQIFSCGTCLEYYHLTEKLRVGQVTNMYEIVDSLLAAGKVIRL